MAEGWCDACGLHVEVPISYSEHGSRQVVIGASGEEIGSLRSVSLSFEWRDGRLSHLCTGCHRAIGTLLLARRKAAAKMRETKRR